MDCIGVIQNRLRWFDCKRCNDSLDSLKAGSFQITNETDRVLALWISVLFSIQTHKFFSELVSFFMVHLTDLVYERSS
jgi:hypothetical protein